MSIISDAEREYKLNSKLDRLLIMVEDVESEEEREKLLTQIEEVELELAELTFKY